MDWIGWFRRCLPPILDRIDGKPDIWSGKFSIWYICGQFLWKFDNWFCDYIGSQWGSVDQYRPDFLDPGDVRGFYNVFNIQL